MANGILIAGLILVLIGSEMAIRGGVGLARRFDIPPLFTGVLVVAVLTATPEFFITLRAATSGQPEMALGGLIGANLAILLLVMGLGALINPMASPPKVVFRDGGVLLLAVVGLIACSLLGSVPRQAGAAMLLLFVGYVVLVFVSDWRRAPEHSVALARALCRSERDVPSTTGSLVVLILGFIALALGAYIAVPGAAVLAENLGWSKTTVALLVLAAGIASPKLFTSLWVAFRGHASVAAGQLLTASVLSLTLVLGLVAVIQPLSFPAELARHDLLMLAGAAAALIPLMAMRWRLSRPRGLLLILGYGCYVGFVMWRQGMPLPWGF